MISARRGLEIWFAVFLYAALIFFFSSIPGDVMPSFVAGSDKIFHFLVYFPFGLLVSRAWAKTIHVPGRSILLATLAVVILYALSDEIHQAFVPGRNFSFGDIFIDCLGATGGSFLNLWQR